MLKTQIPVRFADVFPHGAYLAGIEPINDFDKVQAGVADPQDRDKETGERMWAVRVLDADPDTRAGSLEVKVKIAAPVQPVPPAATPGFPFTQVELDGMSVTPWMDTSRERPRVALSLRARVLRAPSVGAGKGERSGS